MYLWLGIGVLHRTGRNDRQHSYFDALPYGSIAICALVLNI